MGWTRNTVINLLNGRKDFQERDFLLIASMLYVDAETLRRQILSREPCHNIPHPTRPEHAALRGNRAARSLTYPPEHPE
jgi:hypothetical protein